MTKKDVYAAIIAKLPEDDQIALSLYYCDQLTFKEMGAVLDMTPQEACDLYSRAYSEVMSQESRSRN